MYAKHEEITQALFTSTIKSYSQAILEYCVNLVKANVVGVKKPCRTSYLYKVTIYKIDMKYFSNFNSDFQFQIIYHIITVVENMLFIYESRVSSRHSIRNSSTSTLPLGHGGSPQY